MKNYIIFLVCIMFIIAGCTNNQDQTTTDKQTQEKVVEQQVDTAKESEQPNAEEDTHNEVQNSQQEAEPSKNATQENNQAADSDHHHDTSLQIEFQTAETIKMNESTKLSAQILNNKAPLTGATVKFEIWKGDEQNHEFVDAADEGTGIYSATKTFTQTGTYKVKVHVEKEQEHIHNHTETTVEVK